MRALAALAVVASAFALYACTADSGVTPSGDASPDASPAVDAAADGDAECEGVFAYVDNDGDGYGATFAGRLCSPLPDGFANQGGDCDDNDERAHPGQPDFQPAVAGKATTGDYNCDGVVEVEATAVGDCNLGTDENCADGTTHDFWYAVVPGCDQTGTWINQCGPVQDNACARDLEVRPQRCR